MWNAGQDWKPMADSPLRQMLMSKHTLPALSPWEPSLRSGEIKEPKRVDGPKDIWQAALKETDLNPAPTESSCIFTINYNVDTRCTPLAFNFWFWKLLFLSIIFMCLWIILKNINSLKIIAFRDPCTFFFISRPHPLPSFPLLIQFCISEITCLLFIVLF